MAETPNWGIEPVPERLRVLGFLDTFLLWGNLSVSLLVIVAGAFLVPGLSLGGAFAAILVAGIVGNAMLGVAGMIGADARVPAMVVLRAPLGRRGSLLPTALNVLQCLGWSVFELIIIATAASALSEQVFGLGGKPLWTIVMGAIATGLAFLGPVGFVRRYVRKFAVYFVVASLAYLAWWAVHGQHVGALWSKPGNGHDAFWPGVDLVLASIVSWTPLAADYTRFARNGRSAFWGVAIGYLLPTVGLFLLGAILFLTRDLGDAAAIPTAVAAGGVASILALLALTVDESDEAFANVYSGAVSLQNAFPRAPQRLLIAGVAVVATAGALVIDLRNYQDFLFLLGAILFLTRDLGDAAAIPTAVAAGGVASILALLALTVDESDEAFANVYSGAVSLQNAFPRAPQRLLIAGVAAVATIGALVIDLRNYQDFLFLLGSFFVPLFGVLLADWLLAGRHYDADVLFHGPAVRPELIASWLAGFALYQWLAPVGPSWWTSIVDRAHPNALPFGGASLPSFAAAFLLALAVGSVARRRVALA